MHTTCSANFVIMAGLLLAATARAAEPAANCDDIFRSAIAVWHMDGTRDATGRNPLTAVGNVKFGVRLEGRDLADSLATGNDGRVAQFDGGYLSAGQGDGGVLNLSGSALTVSVRLRSPTGVWGKPILSKHGGHDRLVYNLFSFDHAIGFELGVAGKSGMTGVQAPLDKIGREDWHNVICCYDGRMLRMFVDGVWLSEAAVSGPLRQGNTEPCLLAAESYGSRIHSAWQGQIDHAAIWNRALTREEILRLSGGAERAAAAQKRFARLPRPAEPLYHESLRPQFHFTARYWEGYTVQPDNSGHEGWVNDVNGPIWLDGEYHLFGQRWWHAWLHAVSRDLVHWTELRPAFGEGGRFGGTQSGTCVVDYQNVSGLAKGKEPVLIAFWAAQDNQNQCISFSIDRGHTWTKWAKNPVLAHPYRDPKVFWHEPTKEWIMVLCGPPDYSYLIFTSRDLLHWEKQSVIRDMFECPDMFPLALDGDAKKTKWVVVNGDAKYLVGDFDGKVFTPITKKKTGDWGGAAYATQTFNNMPQNDPRRIQVAWLRDGRWPRMPFNQQWSFPVEMTLHTRPDGPTVFRYPIREIERLWGETSDISPITLHPGENWLVAKTGKHYDIEMEIDATGSEASEIVMELAGSSKVRYLVKDKVLESCGARVALAPEDGRVEVRVLLDRTSVEVFGNHGLVSISKCMLPNDSKPPLVLSVVGGKAKLHRLTLHTVKSMWE